MKKLSLLVGIFAALSIKSFAQSPRYYDRNTMFWFEMVNTGAIKGKFTWQNDFQFRTSSNYQSRSNPTQQLYQVVVRPWLHYYLNPNTRFSICPLGFWWSDDPRPYPYTSPTHQFPEFRSCQQFTLFSANGRVQLQQRLRNEVRIIGTPQPGGGFDYHTGMPRDRVRYFLRLTVPLQGNTLDTKEWYFAAQNEIFLNVGSNNKGYNTFDQNRFYAGFGYKLNDKIRLELGYLNQTLETTKVRSNDGVNQYVYRANHNIQLFLFWDNVFQRKRAEG